MIKKIIGFAMVLVFAKDAYAYDNPSNLTVIDGVTTSDPSVTNEGTLGNSTTTSSGLISDGANAVVVNSGNIFGYQAVNLLGYGATLTNTNTGNISSYDNGNSVNVSGFGETVNNYGLISQTDLSLASWGISVASTGGTTTINNYNTITVSGSGDGYGAYGIQVGGASDTINVMNSGTINADGPIAAGIEIDSGSTVDSITNTGSILVSGIGGFGIINLGTIASLSNSQSNLTYSGNLPTNYNIIINSPTSFGRLLVNGGTGQTTFGIHTSSTVANGTYASVLTGLTLRNLTATTGTYGTGGWSLSNSSGDIWDLIISGYTFILAIPSGPSTADTQSSIQASAQKLRSTFNAAAISTNFANMNTYDCNLFDTKGMCISAGGRYTTVDNPSSNSTSAVVVVGYKATPNIRIGGFLDQNVNNNTPSGIQVSNKNPLMGAFAVWNQNANGLGVQVKLANAYQDKEVNTTRDVIGTSEAGIGATNLNTQSYVGELSYAFNYQDKTLLRPYLALRQTTIKQDAYTETGVANPLSYGSLKDRSTTALLGLKLNHAVTPKATLTASLGIEQDLEHSVDQYSATSSSIANLTSENFNDSIKRTRPVASAGAYYAVSKTQRISGDVYYQQLPFQSTGSTTAYFSYMIGL